MDERDALVAVTIDPLRQYSPEELRQLTENLDDLLVSVHRGAFSDKPLSLRLLIEFHAAIFGGVRDHAGRHRERGRGSETLTFGPHRSVHRDLVAGELKSIFERVERIAQQLAANGEDPSYELHATSFAAWAHARIIQIHPFEDGNGRTSRAVLNYLLVRFGLRPVALEVCRQEYLAALNDHFNGADIDALRDIVLSLMDAQLPD